MVGGMMSSPAPGGQIIATQGWDDGGITINWWVGEVAAGRYQYDYFIYASGVNRVILSTPILISPSDILSGTTPAPRLGFFESSDNNNLGLPRDTLGAEFVFNSQGNFQHVHWESELAPVWGGAYVGVDPQSIPPMTVPTYAHTAIWNSFYPFAWRESSFLRKDIPVPGVRRSPVVSVPEPGSLALFAIGLIGLGIASQRRKG